MILKPNSIIAVDFDGTIVEHRFPEIGRELPLDAPCAVRAMQDLQDLGHRIIIWTCRYLHVDLWMMEDWLRKRDFIPDAVNENLTEGFCPHPKIYADIYLDDRSWPPFPGWKAFWIACGLDQRDHFADPSKMIKD